MAREFSRTQRVAGQMQRELAQLIQQEIRDPRLGMVTVADVEVSRDLAHAKVYITVLGEGHDVEITLGILNKAAGFLRHALGQRMKMRTLPALHFFYDASVERGTRLSALINQAVASDRGDKE